MDSIAIEQRIGKLAESLHSGGEAKELCRLAPGEGINAVAWSVDDQYIFFSKKPKGVGKTGKHELWRVSREGGKPQNLGLAMNGLGYFSIHPDGQSIAFSSWTAGEHVWVMENFLPED